MNLIKKILLAVVVLLASAVVAKAHDADNFCSFYENQQNLFPDFQAYKNAGLIGGDVLARDANGNPTIEHCELFIPDLCHDDLEFYKKVKEYWHWRRTLLDNIHAAMESRSRSHIYAHLRGNNAGVRPRVADLDFQTTPDGLTFQRDFRDYWNRIIRSPETQACAYWRHSLVWTRQQALDYMDAHINAAIVHNQAAVARRDQILVQEFYILPFEPRWCVDPRSPGDTLGLAERRTQAWFFDQSVNNPQDLFNIR